MRTGLLICFLLATLISCGGGGGGGSGDENGTGVTTPTYSLALPSRLSAVPTLGATSFPLAVSDYGVGTITFRTLPGTSVVRYDATTGPYQVFPINHLNSEVINAWKNGWTGKGVTISIIDDFNTADIKTYLKTPVISRTIDWDNGNNGKVQGTHSLIHSFTLDQTHGSMTANIAGGDYDGAISNIDLTLLNVPVSETLTLCTTLRAPATWSNLWSCNSSIYDYPSPSWGNDKINLNYKYVAGVAKEANIISNNVNLSSRQDPVKTIADLQGHLKNSSDLEVINLSLGSDIPTSGRSFTEVMNQVAKFPVAKMNAVIAVAAGNGGAPCATQDLNGCNSMAVALAFQDSTKASTIVVGATSGSGTQENIATYSTRAGILADRFVLASGETGIAGVVGTSFAAPRVAGIAAILKQKYPSLTSVQIANIILLSASKDINNSGVDTFTGVSPIYGHGKASLTRALALAESL